MIASRMVDSIIVDDGSRNATSTQRARTYDGAVVVVVAVVMNAVCIIAGAVTRD